MRVPREDEFKCAMSNINPLDVLAVKNVISRYCEALDAKDFALLEKVFQRDVSADYPFNSDLQGVDAVANAIKNRYMECG
jgi:hypothetical protein